MSIEGVDVCYKDVIEPLESVSVTIVPTKTQKLTDLGPPEEVRPAPPCDPGVLSQRLLSSADVEPSEASRRPQRLVRISRR